MRKCGTGEDDSKTPFQNKSLVMGERHQILLVSVSCCVRIQKGPKYVGGIKRAERAQACTGNAALVVGTNLVRNLSYYLPTYPILYSAILLAVSYSVYSNGSGRARGMHFEAVLDWREGRIAAAV